MARFARSLFAVAAATTFGAALAACSSNPCQTEPAPCAPPPVCSTCPPVPVPHGPPCGSCPPKDWSPCKPFDCVLPVACPPRLDPCNLADPCVLPPPIYTPVPCEPPPPPPCEPPAPPPCDPTPPSK